LNADCSASESKKAGELWAIALSSDGQYLASTTFDGKINVWDTNLAMSKIREYETKGSFGMCIDLVRLPHHCLEIY
jgi:superkiller protein 8